MLTRLVPDIKKTAALVSEITASCREQDAGSEQINQAIQQLDKVTQQNASASEEMSATSEELAAQAEQLQSAIEYFHTEAQTEAVAPRAAPQHRATEAAQPDRTRPVVAGRANRTKLNGHKPAPSNGTAMDLKAGGSDGHDSEFIRY
jgi:methyl-accepting chemotaxis protein